MFNCFSGLLARLYINPKLLYALLYFGSLSIIFLIKLYFLEIFLFINIIPKLFSEPI